ncbi:retrovirus-related Pol polyprotein from transposon TNT 1-94 [Trichonephila clavipes]|nr:retrovirus-related Pol polyprotein from transposon TNT 1-94 [Trichonephila clavipes]
MDKVTIPDINGTNYFIWELKMKATLSLKRLDSLILNEKPEDLTHKAEIEWLSKNSDAIAYIKLSLADEQALQFAAEDNAKVLTWEVERGKFYDPVRSLLKSKNQEINRLQLAVKLPWAIFFESVDILS